LDTGVLQVKSVQRRGARAGIDLRLDAADAQIGQ